MTLSPHTVAEPFEAQVQALPLHNTPTIRSLRMARSRPWRDMPAAFVLDVAGRLAQRSRLRRSACDAQALSGRAGD